MIPIYYFFSHGLEWILFRWKRWATFAMLALALNPALLLYYEIHSRWIDPVYQTPFESDVSQYAASLANGHHIFWKGWPYALAPLVASLCENDETTYIYHFDAHVVTFFSGVPVKRIRLPEIPDSNLLSAGDVVIINPEDYMTARDLPAKRKPLIVARVAKKSGEPVQISFDSAREFLPPNSHL